MFELKKVYLHLWIDLHVKLMYTEWLREPAAEEYREGCELFVMLVREHGVECWIAESRKLVGMPIHVQSPVLLQLAPSLVGSSLKKLARIIDTDLQSIAMFEDISNGLKESHQSTIELEQFISFEDAADWIGMIRG
ncbi:hypothetical protein ACFS7Z_14835 [Pontibacter toksunensis]|uniref:SpoIIAA-like protein n=1 Tax=Pontibacter toksunensis TaxID=1332631 RepID=A0ABW6BWE5_9BACT